MHHHHHHHFIVKKCMTERKPLHYGDGVVLAASSHMQAFEAAASMPA